MVAAVFRLRDYRVWLVGDTASSIASSMRTILVPLLAYRLTGSVVDAGVLATVTRLVSLAATLPGGLIVDRLNRRTLIQLYAITGVVCWGGLFVLLAAGRSTFLALCVISVVASLNGGLLGHATDAALRAIVPRSEYPSATAANQGRDAAVELGASPGAGALYAVNAALPSVAMALGYLILLGSARLIRSELAPRRVKTGTMPTQLFGGFIWVWRDRAKRAIVVMLLLVNFGISGLLYIIQIGMIANGTHPALIGLLDTSAAVGSLVGAILAGSLVQRIPTGLLAALGLCWVCFSLSPMAMSTRVVIALPALMCATLAIPAVNAGLVGFFFGTTPDHLQGRVGSFMSLASSGLAALAPLLGGAALTHLGYAASTVGCIAVIATSAIIGLTSRRVRTIQRPSEWETEADAEVQQRP